MKSGLGVVGGDGNHDGCKLGGDVAMGHWWVSRHSGHCRKRRGEPEAEREGSRLL